jgi:long-chain acyl-CoA synthetase
MNAKTIPNLFEISAQKFANNPLVFEKKSEKYTPYSFREIKEEVHNFANGLIQIGIKKDEKVVLLSEGRREWLVAELALLYIGAVVVPISIKLNETSDLKLRLQHSESKFAIVSSRQANKIKHIIPELSKFKNIIILDKEKEEKGILFYSDLVENGKKENSNQLDEIRKSIHQNDVAVLSYTSGTTSDPKGIMLSHRNFTSNVEQAHSLFEVPEWYTTLLILPWDHSFAHTVGLYTMILNGASISVVDPGKSSMETLRNIPINIKETKPVFLLSVPALASNFKKNIENGIAQKSTTVQKMFKHALKISYNYNKEGFNRGKGLSALNKPLMAVYDKILFSKIREGFGGRLKFFVGGGALLDIEIQRFFFAIGMPMYQGYGLTEAAPIISSNSPKNFKLGSSGKGVENIEIKILDENGNETKTGEHGEIVVKGENVMLGYWKNESATYESIHNGWLHTGDMGYLDKDGYLYVLGRFKSLLISNDGEKYSPEGIEEAFTQQSKFIDQCMLYNNQDAYTIGLIVPNHLAVKNYLKENNITENYDAKYAVIQKINEELKQYSKGGLYEKMFPHRWLPSAFGILPEAFTEDNKMLNSTMKMVRNNVVKNNKNLIHFLYTPKGKNILNEHNTENIKNFI